MIKLLDKVTIYYIDFDKELEVVPMTHGGSGCVSYCPNSKHEGVVCQISTSEIEYYNFEEPCEDNDYEEIGFHKETIVKYKVTGWDELLSEQEILYYNSEQAKLNYRPT
jgi:hypothetical protein